MAVGNAGKVWEEVKEGGKELKDDLASGNMTKAVEGVKEDLKEVKDLAATGIKETTEVAQEEADKISNNATGDLVTSIRTIVADAEAEERGLTPAQVADDVLAKEVIAAAKNTEKVQKA